MSFDDEIIIGGNDEVDEMERVGRAMSEATAILDRIPVIEEEPDEIDFSEPITIGGDDDDDSSDYFGEEFFGEDDSDEDDSDEDDSDEDDFDEDDSDEDDSDEDDSDEDDFDEDDSDEDDFDEDDSDEDDSDEDDSDEDDSDEDDSDEDDSDEDDSDEDDSDEDDSDEDEADSGEPEPEKEPEQEYDLEKTVRDGSFDEKTESVEKSAAEYEKKSRKSRADGSAAALPVPVIKPRDLTAVREAKKRSDAAKNSGTGDDTDFRKEFLVTASPHIHYGENTRIIMQDVVIALMPAALVAVLYFGWRAAVTILVSVAASVLSEYICRKIMKRRQTIGDFSAIVTGMLLAFCLPPEINPLFAAVGAVVAVVVVKQMFGGIGMNFANPAATARIVLMLSFPVAMTKWSQPFGWLNGNYTDAVTSATPLALDVQSRTGLRELFFGFHEGCLGEVCAVALIIGGCYLLLRGIITWHIPVCFIGTVMVFSLLVGEDPVYQILTGGVMLGAIFMATDYVTSPSNKWGKVIFGCGCGLITMMIRRFGSMTEGVSFAILLMNILTPHIERLTTPKPYGEERDAA